MSAARSPRHPRQDHRHRSGEDKPEGQSVHARLHLPEDNIPGYGNSPARQLQTELVERLQPPSGISIRATLATILVLCLSMSVATLSLLTAH